MISLGVSGKDTAAWRPPVLKVVASRGEGIDKLVHALDEHRAWLDSSGAGIERRRQRARTEIQGIALAALQARFGGVEGGSQLDALASEVADGRTDAFSAADRIVASVTG
jgi:LAO/AO transport system kinase